MHLNRYSGVGNPEKRVLFLHGFLGRGSDWQSLVTRLDVPVEAWCPDLPGHGVTPPMRLAPTLNALAKWITKCDLVVAYSMGARLALMAAMTQAADQTPLFLESGSIGIEDPAFRTQRVDLDHQRAEQIRTQSPERFLQEWYSLPIWHTLGEEHKARLVRERSREAHPDGWATALEAFSTGNQVYALPFLRQRLANTLTFIAGEKDEAYRRQAEFLQSELPHAHCVVVPEAGHNVHEEKPAIWLDLLRGALRK